jgi:hypothetical protein
VPIDTDEYDIYDEEIRKYHSLFDEKLTERNLETIF